MFASGPLADVIATVDAYTYYYVVKTHFDQTITTQQYNCDPVACLTRITAFDFDEIVQCLMADDRLVAILCFAGDVFYQHKDKLNVSIEDHTIGGMPYTGKNQSRTSKNAAYIRANLTKKELRTIIVLCCSPFRGLFPVEIWLYSRDFKRICLANNILRIFPETLKGLCCYQ